MNALTRLLSPRRIVAVVAVLLVAVAGLQLVQDGGSTTIKATFASGEGLYVGDDVKVLGVKVGKVTGVEPTDAGVVVSLSVDSSQPIPQDAKAAIVSPSLVSGRFVQLAPVYAGGPELGDGDSIPESRTAVPLSFDAVKQQLTDLTSALGPQGGRRGALATAIDAIDRSLHHGNATRLRNAIRELRSVAGSLSNGRGDLFSTIANLNTFTRNLAINDAAVRGFTQQLTSASGVLASNRQNLTGVMRDLSTVLRSAKTFFRHHRARLTRSLRGLNTTAATVASRSNQLAGVLHVAPHSLVDLSNIIENQAITARVALANFDNVPQLICGSIMGSGGTAAQCSAALQPLLTLLGLSSLPVPGIPHGPTTSAGTGTAKGGGSTGSGGLGGTVQGTTQGLSGLLSGLLGGGGR
ncbi:MAG TPA: MCE family protein [Nocardioides sp.]|nr:MCE family protein [Nocardioides sp.]